MAQMDGNDWARHFLAVELHEDVPADVHDLFAVARGTMLYGWFFYPLYALAKTSYGGSRTQPVPAATKTSPDH
jgi:hypothetical protein